MEQVKKGIWQNFSLFATWKINESVFPLTNQQQNFHKWKHPIASPNTLSHLLNVTQVTYRSLLLFAVCLSTYLSFLLVIASYIMHINSSYLWCSDVCFMPSEKILLFCFLIFHERVLHTETNLSIRVFGKAYNFKSWTFWIKKRSKEEISHKNKAHVKLFQFVRCTCHLLGF